jgi:hypothetical protein
MIVLVPELFKLLATPKSESRSWSFLYVYGLENVVSGTESQMVATAQAWSSVQHGASCSLHSVVTDFFPLGVFVPTTLKKAVFRSLTKSARPGMCLRRNGVRKMSCCSSSHVFGGFATQA